MSFTITHRYGSMDRDAALNTLPSLWRSLILALKILSTAASRSLTKTEWCLSAARGGYVVLEHLENGGERHMNAVPRAEILRMWELLAVCKIAELESLPWTPSYK